MTDKSICNRRLGYTGRLCVQPDGHPWPTLCSGLERDLELTLEEPTIERGADGITVRVMWSDGNQAARVGTRTPARQPRRPSRHRHPRRGGPSRRWPVRRWAVRPQRRRHPSPPLHLPDPRAHHERRPPPARLLDGSPMSLTVVPLTFRGASAFVAEHHRHNKPPRGTKFCIGVCDAEGVLRGVAMVGRPVARHFDHA